MCTGFGFGNQLCYGPSAKGAICLRPRRLFTTEEKNQILVGLVAGKTPGQLSRELFANSKFRSTIWLIRKRLQEGQAWKPKAA